MANSYTFTTIAEGDILHDSKSPWNFLPTSLKQHKGVLMWTAPGYATYGTTPTNDTIQYSACAVYCYKLEEKIVLPPNIKRISQEHNLPEFKRSYIAQYKNAAATIDHYHKTHASDNRNFTNAVSNWRDTCDKLVENPHFAEGWDLPAFFIFYADSTDTAIDNFFKRQEALQPGKSALWKKRQQHAEEMHKAWEQMSLYVTSPNNIPFPKSVWYHKFFIVNVQKQPDLWKSYFVNTNFSEWGKIE